MTDEQIDELVAAMREIAQAEVRDAVELTKYNPDDSMSGFGNYGAISRAEERLTAALRSVFQTAEH